MGLTKTLDDIKKERESKCSVKKILDKLDKEERQSLQSALNSKMSRRDILYALRSNGFTLGTDSLAKHKLERCGCKF